MGPVTAFPMFPLGSVLFPHDYLPLNVFEHRYLALVKDCTERHDREFGVVLIESGLEVGGGESRFDVGCVARIVERAEHHVGRLRVGTIGERRIRVVRWLDDDPYPRAEVEDWPDPPATEQDVEAIVALLMQLRRVLAMATELGERTRPATFELFDDPVAASYQLCAVAPLHAIDKLGLLGAVSVKARLERLESLLDDLGTLLASRLAGG
jgi:Lon protease-like protein